MWFAVPRGSRRPNRGLAASFSTHSTYGSSMTSSLRVFREQRDDRGAGRQRLAGVVGGAQLELDPAVHDGGDGALHGDDGVLQVRRLEPARELEDATARAEPGAHEVVVVRDLQVADPDRPGIARGAARVVVHVR